ncbi:MAG: tyrosine-type recombinase/integrase [Deltaproteobacteria bacterium]
MATIRYKKESDKWFVDFRRGFTRKRIHFKTRREAEDFKRALLLRKSGLRDLPNEISETSLKDAVKRYKTTVTSTKSKATQYFEEIVFRSLLDYFADHLVSDIGLSDLQEYQSYLRKNILGQSVNRRFNTLCHFFKTCLDWNLIEENPTLKLRKLQASNLRAKRSLSKEEIVKVLSCAKPWVRDILWFILVFGVRRSQATSLRWSAIDFRQKFVHLESSEGFDNKDYEANTLPMTEPMDYFLRRLFENALRRKQNDPKDHVFVDCEGRAIRPARLTKEAKKLMKRVLGLESGAVHILRHTSLTLRHRQGVSLDAVRAIAGHSNIKTTMLYLHSEPEYLREVLTKTPLVQPFWLPEFSQDLGVVGTSGHQKTHAI